MVVSMENFPAPKAPVSMGVDLIFNRSNLDERTALPVGLTATVGIGKGTTVELHSRIGSTRIRSLKNGGGTNR